MKKPPFNLKFTKYWKIVSRLHLDRIFHGLETHEEKFINSVFKNMNPYDENELSDHQKRWILQLDKKYPKEDL